MNTPFNENAEEIEIPTALDLTPEVINGFTRDNKVLEYITHGDHSVWQEQADNAMQAIEEINAINPGKAMQILASSHAVFQLARNGQEDRLIDLISDLEPAQQADILAADEALFGIIEYAGAQAALDLFEALPVTEQDKVEFNKPSGHIIEKRNSLLLRHARALSNAYNAQPEV